MATHDEECKLYKISSKKALNKKKEQQQTATTNPEEEYFFQKWTYYNIQNAMSSIKNYESCKE